ncbi:MAG: tetratricopeptide repeat protein [Acidobacteria bacterium]|nr:tetratricopeptide repeat protein [Acidobacteriota bacterium]
MSDNRFSRKDLKQQDDFQRGVTHFAGWLVERRRTIGLALLAVVAVGSVLAGVQAYRVRQEQNAAALFAEGMRVYQSAVIDMAGLDAAVASALGEGDSFASDEEKFTAAVAAFQPVVDQYGSQPSGRAAAFYLGISLIELDRGEEAIASLRAAAESGTPLIRAMSLYRLGTLLSDSDQHGEAIAVFEELADPAPEGFPIAEAMFAKARAQEAAGNTDAALTTYQRIADDDPASIYAIPARSRAEELAARLGVTLDAES